MVQQNFIKPLTRDHQKVNKLVMPHESSRVVPEGSRPASSADKCNSIEELLMQCISIAYEHILMKFGTLMIVVH